MRRTLETASRSLGWLLERGVPAQCRGEWQENSSKPCDTGTPVRTVAADFPAFDFSQVYAEWPQKEGLYAFSESAVLQRGRECRQWLRSRPEPVVAVVTHSAFLRLSVTSDFFGNADYRVYDFAADGDALVQRAVTKQNGGGMGKSPKATSIPHSTDFEPFD